MGRKVSEYKRIDSAAVSKALEKRGITHTAASREMGFSSEYMKEVLKRGTVHPSVIKIMRMLYNMNDEEIFGKEENSIEPEQPQEGGFDWETFGRVVEEAVYRGVARALNQ